MPRTHPGHGAIEMHRTASKAAHLNDLEMPGLDPSGIPCSGEGGRGRAGSSRRRLARRLPGLAHTSMIASVMGVAERGEERWLLWGCVEGSPMLFAVESDAAREMVGSLAAGEMATAIIEPWQVMLERLD